VQASQRPQAHLNRAKGGAWLEGDGSQGKESEGVSPRMQKGNWERGKNKLWGYIWVHAKTWAEPLPTKNQVGLT